MRRKLTTLLISIPFAAMAAGITGLQTAEAKCDTSSRGNDFEHHYWDGWKHNAVPNVTDGAYAKIWNYSPWVFNVPNNFSAAWVMLTNDHPYGTDAGYAQVGYLEFAGGWAQHHTFVQEHNYGETPKRTILYAPQPASTYTYYTILYDEFWNRFTYQVAGSSLNEVWSPTNWIPHEAQASGETLSKADQMPGGYLTAGDYVDLFDSEYYTSGAWHYFNPGAQTFIADQAGTDESALFGQKVWNSRDISIWDKKCQH